MDLFGSNSLGHFHIQCQRRLWCRRLVQGDTDARLVWFELDSPEASLMVGKVREICTGYYR